MTWLKQFAPALVFAVWAVVRATVGANVPVDVAFMVIVAFALVVSEIETRRARG